MSHSELLKAANNPLIIIAKDLVLEGLSALLAIHEETQYNYRIQTEPRSFYNKSAPLFFKKALSGRVTRFCRHFFHESNPPVPLINRLK